MKMERMRIVHETVCMCHHVGPQLPSTATMWETSSGGIISPEYNFKILLTFIKTLIKKNDLENSQ